jgi:excisionase family DNA binding protein
VIGLLAPEAVAELTDYIEQVVASRITAATVMQPRLEMMTVEEAGAYLRTTPGAIYKRIKRKQLPAVRIDGSHILIRRQDLDHMLDRGAVRSYDQTVSSKGPARLEPPGPWQQEVSPDASP